MCCLKYHLFYLFLPWIMLKALVNRRESIIEELSNASWENSFMKTEERNWTKPLSSSMAWTFFQSRLI